MKKIGFYCGSFDPFTKGHLAVVCEALAFFDKLIIAIGVNPEKKPLFSIEERASIIKASLLDFQKDFEFRLLTNQRFSMTEREVYKRLKSEKDIVEVIGYSDLTVDCALRSGATSLVRGERIIGDHDAEMQLSIMNRELLKSRGARLDMISINVPREDLTYVSSGAVKALCKSGQHIDAFHYVSASTHHELMKKYLEKDFREFENNIKGSSIPSGHQEDNYTKLCKAYSEPHRFHHNLSHIGYCLNQVSNYDSAQYLDVFRIKEMLSLKKAIFYHDYVNFGKNDDEEKSIEAFQLYEGNDSIAEEIIKATCHFENVTNEANYLEYNLMKDVDLAILGDEENYGRYAQNIRLEYAHIPESQYAAGRIDILDKLCSRKRLFRLGYFYDKFEEIAHENMLKERAYWKIFV